uniref:Ovule protein n=1 Tax=Meloidogyne incognita TaxID=6306 RepID=A0A914MBR5_MELIC
MVEKTRSVRSDKNEALKMTQTSACLKNPNPNIRFLKVDPRFCRITMLNIFFFHPYICFHSHKF